MFPTDIRKLICTRLHHQLLQNVRPPRNLPPPILHPPSLFFSPALESCKTAMFSAGAGTYPSGLYTKCCFEVRGTGQFLPDVRHSNPNTGTPGQIERPEEVRVETICVGEDVVRLAVDRLRVVHSYEDVPMQAWRVVELDLGLEKRMRD